MIELLLVRIFIDGTLIHRWHCHRLPDRSFFLRGRQFHVCARCTGLISGMFFSSFLSMTNWDASRFFFLFLVLTVIDGNTQLIGWRKSNNILRFITGFGLGITSFVFLLHNVFTILDILRKIIES
jgi:uncharacterized membrane protein